MAAAVVLVVAAVVLWYFRPWLHWIVYSVYTTPIVLLAVVVAAVVLALGARVDVRLALQASAAAFVILAVALATVSGFAAGETLGKATLADAEDVDALPETDPDNSRIVPRAVARRYASNTLNFPQYRVAGSDVTVYDGTLHWSYALAPDGIWNYFTKRQHGTVLVDMTRKSASVETVTGDLSEGVGTAFYNDYQWHVLKRGEYLVDYQDPVMVVHEGDQYVAVPYTRPRFHWLPVPHTTPEWGGVVLVDADGEVTDLSPAEAREHPVLEGQRLYPFSLARERVAATKYRNGIVNTFTSHRGEIEVAALPGEGNDQPFTIATEEGIRYVVAVEPYGEAQGLREVWIVDGRTGEFERYPVRASLLGPRKATDYVRQAARTTDWDRFDPSEPIPVVVDDTLYWEVRVVPTDSSGISYVAFVNAETSDVVEVEETADVVAFVRGERVGPPDDGHEPTLIVRRVAPNGTVLGTLEIYGNESVEVVPGNGSVESVPGNETDG